MAGKSRKGVHRYGAADKASGGKAAAPVEGEAAVAANFVGGIMTGRKGSGDQPNVHPDHRSGASTSALSDVCPGVFGEGFCKSG